MNKKWALKCIVVVLAVALVGCGSSDSRDRNVQSLAGQACTKLGQTKVVGKVVHVCGREKNARLWYAAKNKSPKGATCSSPGTVKNQGTGLVVCGSYKAKKIWITVAPLPAIVVEAAESATTTTTTMQPAEEPATAVDSTVPSNETPTSTTVSGGTAESSPETIVATEKEVRKLSAELTRPTKGSLVAKVATVTNGVVVTPAPMVQLVDDGGNPKAEPGVTVRVETGREDVVVKGGTAVTDAEGRAAFENLVVTGPPGDLVLAFIPDGMAAATAATSLRVGDATSIAVSGLPERVVAGEALGAVTAVALLDVAGNVVDSGSVPIAIEFRDTSGANDEVVARTFYSPVFANFELTKSGIFTVRFSAIVDGKTLSTDREIEVVSSESNSLVFAQEPDLVVVSGATVVKQAIVQIVDKYGNPAKKAGVEITAAFNPSPSGKWAKVPTVRYSGQTVITDASGRATFDKLVVTGDAGDYVQSYSAESFASLTAEALLVPGAAADIALVTEPQSFRSGEPAGVQAVVRVVDSAGNTVSWSSQDVQAVVAEGYTVTSATASIDRSGIASFDGMTISGRAGQIDLTFVLGPLRKVYQVELLAGRASELRAVRHATSVVAGETLAFASELQRFDRAGNPLMEKDVYIWGRAPDGDWVAVKTNSEGIAIFKDQTATRAGKMLFDYRTEFYGGIQKFVEVTVYPLEANRPMLITQPSTSVKSGTRLATDPIVQMVDKFGNPVAVQGVVIRAALGGNSEQNASVSGGREVTDKDGRAVFYGMEASGTAGTYRFYFFAYNYSGVWAEEETELLPGEVSKIGLKAQLDGVASGSKPATVPVVVPLDRWGNTVPQAGVSVRVAVTPKNPRERVAAQILKVTGATATTGDDGRASFDSLRISGEADLEYDVTYEASFDGNDYTPISGSTFTLLPGSFARVSVTFGSRITSGTAVGYVLLLDLAGNRVTSTHNVSVLLRDDAKNTWITSGETREVRNGAGNFGTAQMHGPKDSTATFQVVVDGVVHALSQKLTFTSDPVAGVQGPSGGSIIHVGTDSVEAPSFISAGGRILEMSPAGWLTGDPKDDRRTFTDSTDVLPTTSVVFGSGPHNTLYLRSSTTMAETAIDSSFGGFTDWFLPSVQELGELADTKLNAVSGFASRESDLVNSCIWSSTTFNGPNSIFIVTGLNKPVSVRGPTTSCAFRIVRAFG